MTNKDPLKQYDNYRDKTFDWFFAASLGFIVLGIIVVFEAWLYVNALVTDPSSYPKRVDSLAGSTFLFSILLGFIVYATNVLLHVHSKHIRRFKYYTIEELLDHVRLINQSIDKDSCQVTVKYKSKKVSSGTKDFHFDSRGIDDYYLTIIAIWEMKDVGIVFHSQIYTQRDLERSRISIKEFISDSSKLYKPIKELNDAKHNKTTSITSDIKPNSDIIADDDYLGR